MISFHVQNSPQNWLDAIARLPDGSVVKIVMGAERCREVKAINDKLITWYRWVAPDQNLAYGKYEDQARMWFERFVDDTFKSDRVAPYVDLLQEPFNEYHNNGHSHAERSHWQQWTAACAKVWSEYRQDPRLAHIRLVLGGAGVGNDLTLEDARLAVQYDCLLDSHSYTPMANREIMPDEGQHPDGSEINNWKYYSGRFSYMDEYYIANGYRVDWALGEGGPVRDAAPWRGHLQPNDGWNHDGCCNGNVACYLNMIKYWLDNAVQTTAFKEGRLFGMTLFTSGGGQQWEGFETSQPTMNDIAQFVADYMANIDRPPPPPPPDPKPGKLVNGSFEDGWTDQSGQAQEPNGWTLTIRDNGDVRGRPINGGPECVHKHKDQLPPDEQPGAPNELILDGVYVYKMFTQATWAASLYQVIKGLEPGVRVEAIIPVNIHFDGRPDEYDPEDTSVAIFINGEITELWMSKELDRTWIYIKAYGNVDKNGRVEFGIAPSVKWEHPTAFFIDDIRLEKVTEKPPPPDDDCRGAPREQYKRVVLVAHGEATKQQWLSVAQTAYDKKQSAGFSYDDAGIGDLDNRTAILYGIEQARRGEFAHWYATHYEGVVVEFRDYAEPQPLLTSGAIGVDVSHWQGKVNWNQTKAAGAEFCYVKATEGKTFVDGSFEANRKGAQDAGLKVGAYHFLKYHVPGEDQAYNFLRTIGDDIGELPPVLDVEDTDSAVKRDVILAWLRVVEDETEVRPVIYTARWVWNPQSFGGQTPWAGEYKLWIADYSNDPPLLPMGWSDYWLHQYTNEGIGVDYGMESGKVDLNRAA